MPVTDLPAVNASLNGTATLLLIVGFVFIRNRRITAHRACMISASAVSLLFLISYVTYHNLHGFTRFSGEGVIRIVYFSILIPHTILAAVAVTPLALVTLYFAFRGQFERHRRVARWTLPIWLFVSITGVMIYFMLYHM